MKTKSELKKILKLISMKLLIKVPSFVAFLLMSPSPNEKRNEISERIRGAYSAAAQIA